MTLASLIDIALHLNLYVAVLFEQYGLYAYLILMLIVFCETGLIVAPFLPGDSLLFASGVVLASTHRSVWPLIILLIVAAIAGDNLNYWLGRSVGRKIFTRFPSILKPTYLEKTTIFYEKYGPKAIILARFLPILRTFAPFLAGLSKMHYGLYLFFSITGAVFWVGLLTLASYYFGTIPIVKNNFSFALLLIIVASLFPIFWGILKNRKLL